MASVLQQRGAAQQPADQSLKLGLLIRLIRNPVWVVGLACDVAGFAFQVVALYHGPLVVVQPLLVCGLLFALPIGAAWAGRRLSASTGWVRFWWWLAWAFLTVANPGDGGDDAGRLAVLLLIVSALPGLVLAGRGDDRRAGRFLWRRRGILTARQRRSRRPPHICSRRGLLHALAHWQPYVLVVWGIAGMVVGQSAFQAGALDVSLPTMTVVDPIEQYAVPSTGWSC